MSNTLEIPQETLLSVSKPARYIGREINIVNKNPEEAAVRFALCFPDVYEVGMSNLGMQILYFFLNRRDDVYCERAYTPMPDMEAAMRGMGLPLYSLETYTPLAEFDFIGITLQFEMCYTNILTILDLAGLSLLAAERGEDGPIVIGGGPCCFNPEPIAGLFDCFYIGEGEVKLDEIMDLYKKHKAEGGKKTEFLVKLLALDGIYVPRFYDAAYNADGTLASFTPSRPEARTRVRKLAAADLTDMFVPDRLLVPLLEVIHDRVSAEVFRGCSHGCRFCQAGFVCRPVREKKADNLKEQILTLVENTGHEEVSLVSLSTGDYSEFARLAPALVDELSKRSVNLTLPSLRVDAFTLELMERLQAVRKSGITFAPEAGTQRLRDAINKNITEEEILDGCRLAFSGGWDKVKLYFMVGLPLETEEDLLGISILSKKITDEYFKRPKSERNRPINLSVSASLFVPKPFTPFQWAAQNTKEEFLRKARFVREAILRDKHIRFAYNGDKIAVLEGLMARGDRRVLAAIIGAWQGGARFDSWSEHFKPEVWEREIENAGLSVDFYCHRERPYDEILPWDFIDIGVTPEYLKAEAERAKRFERTPGCLEFCGNCGGCDAV